MNPPGTGFKSSTFWLAAVGHALIAGLGYVQLHVAALGAPPWAVAIGSPILALALAWLNKEYGDNQVEIHTAATQAAQAATANPPAVLNK